MFLSLFPSQTGWTTTTTLGRATMKRVLHEESEEEERLQGLVRALDSAGEILTFGFEELDTLLRAFRFHPQRLLRLMQSSKAVNQAVETALADDPRFWYDSCVAAFPDVVIMLETCERLYPYRNLSYAIVNDNPRVDWRLLLMPRSFPAWQFYATVEHAEENSGAQEFDLAICHSFATANKIDADFTDPSHWHKRFSAEQMAQHFAFFYPYALPPVEYCFLSRVKAQSMLFELLSLMPKQNAVRYACNQRDKTHNVYTNDYYYGSGHEKRDLATSMYWRYFERDAEAKEVFDLDHLVREIARLVRQVLENDNDEMEEGEGLTMGAVPGALALFKRVRAAQLLHSKEPFIGWGRGSGAGEYEPGVPELTYTEYGQTLREGREELLRLYGTVDPLYWDVLLMGRPAGTIAAAVGEGGDPFDVIGEMDWKRVVVTQLEWVKRYAPKTHPIHKAIQSAIPDTAFACHTCGAAHSLSVQSCAPFGIYCSDGCLPT
jgi:hypothetical protein